MPVSEIERDIWQALERFYSADGPDMGLYILIGDLVRKAEAELSPSEYQALLKKLKNSQPDIERLVELSRSPAMDIFRAFAMARGVVFPKVKKPEQMSLPY